jgi:hypothetical protein
VKSSMHLVTGQRLVVLVHAGVTLVSLVDEQVAGVMSLLLRCRACLRGLGPTCSHRR